MIFSCGNSFVAMTLLFHCRLHVVKNLVREIVQQREEMLCLPTRITCDILRWLICFCVPVFFSSMGIAVPLWGRMFHEILQPPPLPRAPSWIRPIT